MASTAMVLRLPGVPHTGKDDNDANTQLAVLGGKPLVAYWRRVLEEAVRSTHLLAAWRPVAALSSEVFSTAGLTTLRLMGCGIEELPDLFGPQHARLQVLDLMSNALSSLPDSVRACEGLRELYLARNRLAELPVWLGALTGLTTLELHSNQLVELPRSVGNLHGLTELVLDDNRLTEGGLPDTLTHLPHLRELSLTRNRLAALPDWMGRMPALESLSADRNGITTFPLALHAVRSLRHLSLASNAIAALPEGLGRFTQLRELLLPWNDIPALPVSLRLLTHLEVLRLDGNPLHPGVLDELITKGVRGAMALAHQKADATVERRRQAAVRMFLRVCAVIAEEALASPAVFNGFQEMIFEGLADRYHAIDWEPFFATAWPAARHLWAERALEIHDEKPPDAAPAPDVDGDGDGSDAGSAEGERDSSAREITQRDAAGDGSSRAARGGAGGVASGNPTSSALALSGPPLASAAERRAPAKVEDTRAEAGTFWALTPEELEAVLTAHRFVPSPQEGLREWRWWWQWWWGCGW
jgi:hypothetical protein